MSQGSKLDAHLFVCTNQKSKGECCAARGGAALRDRVKAVAKERWGDRVRVNAAGCLGRCEEGIAAVIYPEGRWLLRLGLAEQTIVDALCETLDSKK